MNFKLTLSSLALGLVAVTGCSADSSEEATTTESDIVAPLPPVKVQGAWRQKVGGIGFEGIVFNEDGTFFADVYTGIMCVMAPCPTHVRLEGNYVVFGRSLILTPKDPASTDDFGFLDRYTVTRTGDTLEIKRVGDAGFANELSLETSYCGAPTDCDGQNLIHPMCVGGWTCSPQNTCGWSCGIVPPADTSVWPVDRTQLVAETKGGGFTPPAPAGSTCTVGAAKYTLDLISRKLAWETCSFTDWSTPMHTITGSRTITTAELKKVDAAMKQVKLTNEQICGADKPMLNLRVSTATQGTKEYTDSFYSCMGGERLYVDNIDGVFSAFRTLAGE